MHFIFSFHHVFGVFARDVSPFRCFQSMQFHGWLECMQTSWFDTNSFCFFLVMSVKLILCMGQDIVIWHEILVEILCA